MEIVNFHPGGRVWWPRAVASPRLPQIRTCPIRASGSSADGFAARRMQSRYLARSRREDLPAQCPRHLSPASPIIRSAASHPPGPPGRVPRPHRYSPPTPTSRLPSCWSGADTGPQSGATRSPTPSPGAANRRVRRCDFSRRHGYARPKLQTLSRQVRWRVISLLTPGVDDGQARPADRSPPGLESASCARPGSSSPPRRSSRRARQGAGGSGCRIAGQSLREDLLVPPDESPGGRAVVAEVFCPDRRSVRQAGTPLATRATCTRPPSDASLGEPRAIRPGVCG